MRCCPRCRRRIWFLQAHAQTDPVLDVIARINAYRIEQGLQPLAVNGRLEAMARDQAEYIASLPDIPDGGDIHLGRRGDDARQRAGSAPYSWETYGTREQISVSEIAGVGSVNSVFSFWMSSSLHHNTIINPAYREIGVWAVKHPFGYIIMAVLGSRPDVLPVLHDPTANRLYLSNEYYARGSGNWLRQVRTIRLFGADGRPLTDERDWTLTLAIPPGAGDQVFVLFDDGTTQLLRPVDLAHDIAILPDTLAMVAAGAAPTTQPATAVAAAPSPTPTPAQSGQLAQAPASTPIPTPTSAVVPTATRTPTAAPPANPDFRLEYDPRSLMLLNLTQDWIDISAITITGGGHTLATTAWSAVAPVRLDLFSPGACLHVWAWSEPVDLAQPASCRARVSYIYVAPEGRFWASGDFEVKQNGVAIAQCKGGTGTCDVKLAG